MNKIIPTLLFIYMFCHGWVAHATDSASLINGVTETVVLQMPHGFIAPVGGDKLPDNFEKTLTTKLPAGNSFEIGSLLNHTHKIEGVTIAPDKPEGLDIKRGDQFAIAFPSGGVGYVARGIDGKILKTHGGTDVPQYSEDNLKKYGFYEKTKVYGRLPSDEIIANNDSVGIDADGFGKVIPDYPADIVLFTKKRYDTKKYPHVARLSEDNKKMIIPEMTPIWNKENKLLLTPFTRLLAHQYDIRQYRMHEVPAGDVTEADVKEVVRMTTQLTELPKGLSTTASQAFQKVHYYRIDTPDRNQTVSTDETRLDIDISSVAGKIPPGTIMMMQIPANPLDDIEVPGWKRCDGTETTEPCGDINKKMLMGADVSSTSKILAHSHFTFIDKGSDIITLEPVLGARDTSQPKNYMTIKNGKYYEDKPNFGEDALQRVYYYIKTDNR